MMPMPPTSSEIEAIAARSRVMTWVAMTETANISAMSRTVKSGSWPGAARCRASSTRRISSAALAGELAYFGSHNGRLYAVNAKSGQLAWQFQTEGSKRDPLKLLNEDGSLNREAMTPTFGDFQDMYVDFYRFASVGAIMGSPAVDRGVVYIGSMDGNLYALQ